MNQDIAQIIKQYHYSVFKKIPLMAFAPGRINLIGEHTDYNDGFVFPAAIDKGIYAAVSNSVGSNKSSIIAIDENEPLELDLNDLKPIENGGWKNYVIGVVAEILKKGRTIENFNLVFGGDIPNGAGLSSSAALENSVVFALNELFQLKLTKEEMIHISQKAEHKYVGVHCGIMDQFASMFGEARSAILLDCQNLEATPITLNLEDHSLLLINTNVKHSLAESAYNNRRQTCEEVASLLGLNSLRDASESDLSAVKPQLSNEAHKMALYVVQENKRVLEAFIAVQQNDLNALGKLLYDSHQGLQQQYKVSCDELDFLVDYTKMHSQVLGARMMGGGFGGCTLNLVKTSFIPALKNMIAPAYKSAFQTDCSFYEVAPSKGAHTVQL